MYNLCRLRRRFKFHPRPASGNYRGEILERTGSHESLVPERTILNIDPDQSIQNFSFCFNGLRQYAAAVRLISRGAWYNYVAPGISHFQPLLYHLHVNESCKTITPHGFSVRDIQRLQDRKKFLFQPRRGRAPRPMLRRYAALRHRQIRASSMMRKDRQLPLAGRSPHMLACFFARFFDGMAVERQARSIDADAPFRADETIPIPVLHGYHPSDSDH